MTQTPTTGLVRVDDNTVQILIQGQPKAVITPTGIVSTFDASALAAAVEAAVPISALSGTLAAAQMPALTGDVTTPGGSLATTLAAGNASVLNSGTLLAARMPALTGDVTSSAGTTATSIVAGAVTGDKVGAAAITYDKIQNVASKSFFGNNTAAPAPGTNIGIDASLGFSGATIQRAALTGDVTASAGSNATTLAAGNAGNLNSGTLLAARMPAHTGDVTSSAGSVALTLAAGNAGNLNSGTLLAARMPALTGDVTTSAGTVATAIGSNKVTNAMLAQGAAHTLVCVSGNATANRGDLSVGTNQIVQNVAGVLTALSNPANLDLSATTNDLGGASGAKGRMFLVPFSYTGSGSTATPVGFNIDGQNMDSPQRPMPVACKLVEVSVNIHHTTGASPGNWTITTANATAGTSGDLSATTTNLANADNVTVGAPTNLITFSAGDRLRSYANAGGNLTSPMIAGFMTFVTT